MILPKIKPIGDPSRQPKVAQPHVSKLPPPKKKRPCRFCQEVRNTFKSILYRR